MRRHLMLTLLVFVSVAVPCSAQPYRALADQLGRGDFSFDISYGSRAIDRLVIVSIDARSGSFTGTFIRIDAATDPLHVTGQFTSAGNGYLITFRIPTAFGPRATASYNGSVIIQPAARTAFMAGTNTTAGAFSIGGTSPNGSRPFCAHGSSTPG